MQQEKELLTDLQIIKMLMRVGARPDASKAIYLGICDNISDSTEIFGVDKSITRAQAVALMGRLLAPDKVGYSIVYR